MTTDGKRETAADRRRRSAAIIEEASKRRRRAVLPAVKHGPDAKVTAGAGVAVAISEDDA